MRELLFNDSLTKTIINIMKINNWILISLLFLSQNLKAQQTEVALGRLDYDLMVAYETEGQLKSDLGHLTYKNTLLFGKQASIDIERMPSAITSYKLQAGDQAIRINENDLAGSESLQNEVNNFKKLFPDLVTSNYKLYTDNTMYSIKNNQEVSIVAESSLPVIDWKLFDEEKSIQGIKVNKAKAQYKGREYTAWYTAAIPVPAGPWQLNGLPGLILEAYDESGEIKMLLTNLSTSLNVPIAIAKPTPLHRTVTVDEYRAILRKKEDERTRMMRASGEIKDNSSSTKMLIRTVSFEKK